MTYNQTVDIIKNTARSYLPDAEVLLFGSRARNDEKQTVIMISSWSQKQPWLLKKNCPLKPGLEKLYYFLVSGQIFWFKAKLRLTRRKNFQVTSSEESCTKQSLYEYPTGWIFK